MFQCYIALLVLNNFSFHQYFLLELKEQKFVLVGKKLFSGNRRFQKEESVKKSLKAKKVFSNSFQSKTLVFTVILIV